MIGLIGCGAMGGAMAARLRDEGMAVLCQDALPEARARMANLDLETVERAVDVADRCDTIILSLPRAEIVRAVMADLHPALRANSLVLDTSTSEPATTRDMATMAGAAGYAFVDGPVSGGPQGARSGTMTMVLGGDAAAIARLRPLLDLLTGKTVHVGPSGAGHAAKIANNLLCAANLVLVSEMARLAEAGGVSFECILEGVNAGSGRSGVSEVNFPRWILNGAFDSGFTMGLMRKDVGLAVAQAQEAGLDLPATRAIAEIWEASRDRLADSADFNEIYKFGRNP